MTTIVTADWQLSDNVRDEYRWALFPKLRSVLKKLAADRLVVLGDLTEEKDRHGAVLTNRVADELRRLSTLCEVIIVPGNHDALDPRHPFFQFVDHIEGVDWIEAPWVEKWSDLGGVALLPFTHTPTPDWAGLDLSLVRYVFCHQTFAGARIGPRTFDGIDPGMLPPHVRIIAGDIHVPQTFGNVTYAGAPYTVDFGDDYQGRVLVLRGAKVTSLPLKLPQKRLLIYGSDDVFHGTAEPGDIVKVRVPMTAAEYADWGTIKHEVLSWGHHEGLIVHMVQPVLAPGERQPQVRAQPRRDDKTILRDYARRHGIDKDTLATGLALCE